MRKIKSLANKLKEKYYRTKETICGPDNTFPGDVFHSERFDNILWKSSGNYDLNTFSFTDGMYYGILSGGNVNLINGELSDDVKYGRYEWLEKRKWYIKDESSPDIYNYTWTSIPISSYKHDIVVFKTVYDTIDKYTTSITHTQLDRIKELSGNSIVQELVPANYFGFNGSTPRYKHDGNPVAFNETDGEEQIEFMKKWVYSVRSTGTPKYELYGWADKMGKTDDTDINTEFNAVLAHLDLLPSFLPKDLNTFDHARYGINTTSPFTNKDITNKINTLLSPGENGVLHNGSGLKNMLDIINGIDFGDFGILLTNSTAKIIEDTNPGATHDTLRTKYLKSSSEDLYYSIKDDLYHEYPNASKVIGKILTLSEEELDKIRNDAFRKVTVDVSTDSLYNHADEEKLKLTELLTAGNEKLRKYHVLDLILRNVEGFKLPELAYLTDEFIAAHPANRVIYVGYNNHYCYVPIDAETYSMSTEDYVAKVDPITIGAHTDESVITNNAKPLPFTKEQFKKFLEFQNPSYYSNWASLQLTDYRFVSSAREVINNKQGQRITKQFEVYTVKGSTELLVVNNIMSPIEFPQLYDYDVFKKFYDDLGYTINKPVAPTEEQITEYVNALNINPNNNFPWSKIEEIDSAGLNAKKIYQHMSKRDIFSPDNYSEFVSAYTAEHDHEHNMVNIVLSKNNIGNLTLIEDSEDSNMVIRVKSKPSFYYAAGTEKDQYNSVIEFILGDNSTAREWLNITDADDLYNSRLDESSRYAWLVDILGSYKDGTLLTKLNDWLSHIDRSISINADKLKKVVETNVSGVKIEVVHISSLLTYGDNNHRDNTLGRVIEVNNTYVVENTICQIEGHEGWLFILHYDGENYIGNNGTPNVINHGYDSPDNKTLVKFLKTL